MDDKVNGHERGVECERTAVVCIAKDEDYYLFEWLDYHLRLGFDDAYVYCNNWRYSGKIPELPGKEVKFFELNGPYQQTSAYNDFISRFSSGYHWVAFIDVDEYIANTTSDDLKDVLNRYSKYSEIAVNWRPMGDSGLTSFSPSNTSLAFRFTMGARHLFHATKRIVNFKWFRDAGKPLPKFGASPHFTDSASVVSAGGEPVQANSMSSLHGLDTVLPLELYHYRVKTQDEFVHVRLKRGDVCDGDGRFMTRRLMDILWHNRNEVELTVVRDFYAKALLENPASATARNGEPAPAVAEEEPQPSQEDTLSIVYVCHDESKGTDGLFARYGLVPRPAGLDWCKHALPIFRSLGRAKGLTDVKIAIDTMPLITVDQLVAGSGFRPPDYIVLDAKSYGIPVLYGAMHTLMEHKPALLFSATPPGWKRNYDTVEHYMRFLDLMEYANYWLVHRPTKWDYVMQYVEVPSA